MKEQEVHKELEKEDGQAWEEDGIVYVDGRIYILNSQKIKEKILQENYEPVDIEHPEQQQMMDLIKRNYWWPGIKNDVKRYVQGCFKYQQNKAQHMKKVGEIHSLKTPEGLWKEISIYIIGLLLKSNKKDTIIVIVDWFTKMIWLKVTTINVSLEEIAKIYQDEIWKLHRIPRTILSDREPQFTSRFIENLTKALGAKQMPSTIYHPQTDGQIEQINQEIGTLLWHYVNYQQDNWMEWLVAAEFQYNDKKHAVTEYIPFELNFGRHPWKGDLTVQMEFPKLEEFLISLQKSWKEATKVMDMAK